MDNTKFKEKVRLTVLNHAPDEAEHFHQDIELLYIMEGTLDVKMGEQTVHMKSEDVLVVNANKKHSLKGSDNILCARLTIEYHLVSDVFDSMSVIFWCDSTKDDNERYDHLRAVLKKLLNHHLTSGGNVASFAHISLCYHLIDLLSSYFLVQTADKENGDENDKFDERIQQINNYIRANYNQPISLKELSEKLYLSNGYLSRFFKRNYGMNFAEYLTNIRLFHAVDDLLYSNTPITMIAYDNGFASVAVFNKAFKKAYGETPSALRKKSKDQKKEDMVQPEEDKELEERLEKYLTTNHDTEEEEHLIETQQNSHSVRDTTPLKFNWSRTLNMGMAADILKSEIQEHIILLKEALNFEYVRFCNIFTKELFIDMDQKEGKYNFTRLDSILDFLLRIGVKPHIEMGAKPRYMMYNVQTFVIEGEREVGFPEPAVWKQFLEGMLRHLVHRYGRHEVNSWRMELWFNENKWDEAGSQERYLELFRILKKTVKQYSDKLQVGGCGIRFDYQEEEREQLYLKWAQSDCRPDFLSMILYPYDRGKEKNDIYSKRCTDDNCIKHKLELEKIVIARAGLGAVPFHVTEWNVSVSSRNIINDSAFKGAYIIKNVLDTYGKADDMAYWLGSDRASEYYDSNQLLYGGTGLMTKDGIIKPAGFAFEFLHRLFSKFVGMGKNYLISTDGHDSYGIVCHNQRMLGYNYFFTKENEIERDRLWKYFEDRDDLELNLELQDVENGHYQVKSYRISEQNGSVLNIWKDMDFEPELSRNDIKYFRRVCEPKLTIQKTEVKDHVLKLHIPMIANEIVFVRVRLMV